MEPLIKVKFPVAQKVESKDVFEIVADWMKGARNFTSAFSSPKDVLESIVKKESFSWQGLSGAVIKKERFEEGNTEYNAMSFKHPGQNLGDMLDTKICFKRDRDGDKSVISAMVEYGSSSCFHMNMESRKPVLVNMLIDQLPHGIDGWIPISSAPRYLEKGDEFFLGDLLKGINANNSLPIVYVTRENKTEKMVVEPELLAKKLAGISHVFVEPHHTFSNELRDILKSKDMICYDGGIRIYWPRIFNPRWNRFWTRGFFQEDSSNPQIKKDPIKEIYNHIIGRTRALSLGDCSYDHVVTLVKRREIIQLNTKVTTLCEEGESHEKLRAVYDGVISSLESDKGNLESQVVKLTDELEQTREDLEVAQLNLRDFQEYKKRDSAPKTRGIADSKEVLLALDSFLKSSGSKISPYFEQRLTGLLSERGDEVSQIVEGQEKAVEEIANAFNGYSRMRAHQIQILHKHGFSYSEDGGHYKVFKQGFNQDICVTLAKTPSDVRSGKNFVRDLTQTFFKI